MERCYFVSLSVLREVLDPLASLQSCYRVVPGSDTVTVIRYGPKGVMHQLAFPVVYRIPEVVDDAGTMILMVAPERGRESESFWKPIEKQLVRDAAYASA